MSIVQNELSLAYPFTPLVENLLDSTDHTTGELSECNDNEVLGCQKTSLWGLHYAEPATAREYTRFSHRALDGALVMFLYALGTLALFPVRTDIGYLAITFLLLAGALITEVVLHVWKRAGTSFTYNTARVRHAMNILCAVTVVSRGWSQHGAQVDCRYDPSYSQFWGYNASTSIVYKSCFRTINEYNIVIPLLALFTLRLDIFVHFAISTLYWLIIFVSLVFVEYSAPSTDYDFVGATVPPTGIAIRVIFCTFAVLASNLVAITKCRTSQREMESALDLVYQSRASRKRLELVDTLMSTMVPPSALATLLDGGKVLDHAAEASVLFSDMVQFTFWSSQRTAQQVVEMLSILVKGIDVLAADVGVSKVKTIGDCYWAVTGIPKPMPDHARVMIRFGLAMLELVRHAAKDHQAWDYPTPEGCTQHLRRPIAFRTGINSGPVSGGVFGTQQISYEIFGETSRRANEVESNGVANCVTVSAATRNLFLKTPSPPSPGDLLGARQINNDDEPEFDFSPLAAADEDVDPGGVATMKQLFVVSIVNDGQVRVPSPVNSPAQAKEQRRRFVEEHLLDNASEASTASGDRLGGPTYEEVKGALQKRKYFCCVHRFVSDEVETEYKIFAADQLISMRLSCGATLLLFYFLLLALSLVDHFGELPVLAVFVLLLAIASQALCIVFAARREAGRLNWVGDEVGPALCYIGSFLSVLGCKLVPDATVTNNPSILGAVFLSLALVANGHWSCIVNFAIVCSLAFFNHYIPDPERHVSPVSQFLYHGTGIVWAWMVMSFQEQQLRCHFIDYKVAKFFEDSQQLELRAQEAVLTSMLPDFVITPLRRWLASNFDPNKAVTYSSNEISVAFLKMHSSGQQTFDWLFQGHDAIDKVLATSNVVDKVKTVGDVVIIAGSFRGHSGAEAAQGMVTICLALHELFRPTADHREDEREDVEYGDDGVSPVPTFLSSPSSLRSLQFPEGAPSDQVSDDVAVVIHVEESTAQVSRKPTSKKRSRRPTFRRSGSPYAAGGWKSLSSQSFPVSIGIHSGPVQGIILGYSRLAFDIFGDTVNTAHRVMSAPQSMGRVMASTDLITVFESTKTTEEVDLGPLLGVKAKGKDHFFVRELSKKQ